MSLSIPDLIDDNSKIYDDVFKIFVCIVAEVSGSSVEHVHHNHTYHMSPEGPSGLSRPSARDKQKSECVYIFVYIFLIQYVYAVLYSGY